MREINTTPIYMRRCRSLNKPETELNGPEECDVNPNFKYYYWNLRSKSLDPIKELHIALGRGEPGARSGTVKRWVDFKNMIRIRQLTIEATRVRKLITYKKAVTGVCTEESDDSYAYYMNLIP